jgi:hypothetical protein
MERMLQGTYKKEGLKNYNPIEKNGQVYGVNTIKGNPQNMVTRLLDPKDVLYDKKYESYVKSDMILDMQYFNNASSLIFELSH